MRAPADMPRRSRRVPGRGRVFIIVLAVLLFLLFTSLRTLANFWTDYLWFDAVDQSSVWSGLLGSKIVLAAIFTGIFFVLAWLNLVVADRIAPRFRFTGPEDELLNRYHAVVDRRAGLVRVLVALAFALIAGVSMGSEWKTWLLFVNGGDFNQTDATFGMNVGFYVFKLPFYVDVVNWLFASMIIVLLITVVAHYLNGGIRLQAAQQRVTPQVKAHISVLLAVLALVKAASYWLDHYEIVFSQRGVVDGATYTEYNAVLPAIYLLLVISLLSCLLFLYNIRRRGWVLPIVAVGLWALVALVAGEAYPAFIQKFQVQPNESDKEAPYIANNIDATRKSYGLETVRSEPFRYTDDPAATQAGVVNNPDTIRNIRLLDPIVVRNAFQRQQAQFAPYQFADQLDVDRYRVRTPDGTFRKTAVVLSGRDLNIAQIPSQSGGQATWENSHVAYTHGYAVALAAANATTEDGSPDYLVKDVPVEVVKEQVDTQISEPNLYFAERFSSDPNLGNGYAVVGTQRDEVAYQTRDNQSVTTNYLGKGGVQLDSTLRRAAYAARFGDLDLLVSGFITDKSRIIYNRGIRERLTSVAPFIVWDADPYPVLWKENGHIIYMLDGYTTTDSYPNAEQAGDFLESDRVDGLVRAGQGGSFNYARNSVKATVDAYDGTIRLYVWDQNDPIVRAWASAFPSLFSDKPMPAELQEHARYPTDLFRLQTNVWGRYHLTKTLDFYQLTGAWSVAQEPPNAPQQATPAASPTTSTPPLQQQGQGGAAPSRGARPNRMTPFYEEMQLPGEKNSSFLVFRPFVPYSDNDNNQQLASFMVAKSDPGSYGQLILYELPSPPRVNGPLLVNSAIQSDPTVSREITLLNQQGSKVEFGNMLLIPLDNTLIYVRPLYVTPTQGQTQPPQLQRVIVVSGQTIKIGNTLRCAFDQLFPDLAGKTVTLEKSQRCILPGTTGSEGGLTPSTTTPPPSSTTSSSTSTTTPSGSTDAPTLYAQAQNLLDQADQALKQNPPDLGQYQEKVRQAAEKLAEANRLSGAGAPSTTTSTTAPTPGST